MIKRIKYKSLATAATLAVLLSGCAGGPKQASTGEYLDDTALTAKVKTALLRDPEVSGLAINVETFKGEVQLSGFANSEAARRHAGELARSVPGVDTVRNDIRLK